MSVVNVHEAKTHLSRLLERAHAGEEVIIAKNGKPYARLCPLNDPPPRRPGLLAGELGKRSSILCRRKSWKDGRAEVPPRHPHPALVLASQSVLEDVPLLSCDEALDSFGARRIW